MNIFKPKSRTRTHADVAQADVSQIESWWDGTGFDRILIDAPCSATGTMYLAPASLNSLLQATGSNFSALNIGMKSLGIRQVFTSDYMPLRSASRWRPK